MGVCFEGADDCGDYEGDKVDVEDCTDERDTTGEFLDCVLGTLNDYGDNGWRVVSFGNVENVYYGVRSGTVLLLERANPE